MKSFFIVIVLSVFLTDVFGQAANTPIIPPSPTVASLGKYGDIPVGTYTGIPNIGIPLYEVKSGQITLPITLNYFAGGIKVEEVASWVGLGWSLNAGGVITRSVMGAPDNPGGISGNTGYADNVQKLQNGTLSAVEQIQLENLIDAKAEDSEPDIFYYNFAGYSGKFFIGTDKQTCYTIPYQKIDIHFENDMQRWVVKTPDGMKYVFGQSIINPNNTAIEQIQQSVVSASSVSPSSTNPATTGPVIKNGWYLMEVTSPSGDVVSFNYNTYTLQYRTLVSETNNYKDYPLFIANGQQLPFSPPCQNCFDSNIFNFSTNLSYTCKLKSITYKTGQINFNTPNTYRADLYGDKSLQSIAIYDYKDLNPIKTYNFNYSYFTSLAQPIESNTISGSNYDPKDYRLKLNSIVETGSDGVSKPPYQFQYNESTPLPMGIYSPVSVVRAVNPAFAQDYWGYYNGRSNTTLSPSYIDGNPAYPIIHDGGDRRVDTVYAQADILTQITYPTGGNTTFQYESNRVPFSQIPQNVQVPLITKGDLSPYLTLDDLSQTNPNQKSITFSVNSLYKNINGIQGAFVNISDIENGYYIRLANGLNDGCPVGSEEIYNSWTLTNTTTGQQLPVDINGTGIFLPNGNYNFTLSRTANSRNCKSVFVVALSGSQYFMGDSPQSTTNMYVGGLRIKKVTSYDGYDHQKDIIKKYSYNLFTDPLTSSGSLVSIPVFGWKGYKETHYCQPYALGLDTTRSGTSIVWSCIFSVLNSNSNYPLCTTQGSFVGYANVSELEGSANGRTDYTYTTANDYSDYGAGQGFPFPPNTSVEWRRGLLTNETSYGNNNNKIKSTGYSYTFNPIINVQGLRLGLLELDTLQLGVYRNYVQAYYNLKTEWYYLNSETTTLYDSNNPAQSVQSQTIYKYNNPNHLQLSETVVNQSNGDLLTTKNLYPADYSPGTSFIDNLTASYIHNIPIEKVVYKTDNTNAVTILSGQINTYKSNGTGLLDKSYKLESLHPIQASNFSYSNSSGAYSPDTRYYDLLNPQIACSYDNYNKINQTIYRNIAASSYQWGYNNEYPVAGCKNAPAKNIFYDSFEEGDGNSAPGDAKTGHYSYNGSTAAYAKNLTGLDAGSYTLSYWSKAANGTWSLVTTSVTVSGTSYNLSIPGKIDDVRFYPSNAQMTTYTYDPLIGMTSAADAKSEITYYEYDSLQRLVNIKDKDGNIIKHYDYHYQGQ